MPQSRWLLALITRVHRWLYRASGGRMGAGAGRKRFLLLEHVGRKSGVRRVTPLLYVPDAGRWVVAGSNLGDAHDPAWWRNLRERPETTIQVGRRRIPVYARRASGAEQARLWAVLCAHWPQFPEYLVRSGRDIPVIVLEPAEDAAITAPASSQAARP